MGFYAGRNEVLSRKPNDAQGPSRKRPFLKFTLFLLVVSLLLSCGGGGGDNGGSNDGGSQPDVSPGKWVEYEPDVLVYVPNAGLQSGEKRALMVNLHGCNMTKEDMKALTHWDTVADEYNMVVAIPDGPGFQRGEKTCWNYKDRNRDEGDVGYVISLALRLVTDGELGIDPDKVFVSGFSYGGGMAAVLACVAPDVFTGVGIDAGEAVEPNMTADAAAGVCIDLAAGNARYLATQSTSIFVGSEDSSGLVRSAPLSADTMNDVYSLYSGALFPVVFPPDSTEPFGTKMWSDGMGPRISMIIQPGGHAWPNGVGYWKDLNYTEYLTQFLVNNNRRAR